MEKIGTIYGGWFVPINMNLNENSIIYSGGAGEDISFDIKLQNKYKNQTNSHFQSKRSKRMCVLVQNFHE